MDKIAIILTDSQALCAIKYKLCSKKKVKRDNEIISQDRDYQLITALYSIVVGVRQIVKTQ